jgi:hypothetical protein
LRQSSDEALHLRHHRHAIGDPGAMAIAGPIGWYAAAMRVTDVR